MPPEEAVAALGENSPTWGDRRRGYSYLAGIGVSERMWSKMMRAYDPLREQLIEAVRLGAPYRDPMDEVTAELFGDLFAERVRHRGPRPAIVGQVVPRDVQGERVRDDDDDDYDPETNDLEDEVLEDEEEDRQAVFTELRDARRRDLGETRHQSRS